MVINVDPDLKTAFKMEPVGCWGQMEKLQCKRGLFLMVLEIDFAAVKQEVQKTK